MSDRFAAASVPEPEPVDPSATLPPAGADRPAPAWRFPVSLYIWFLLLVATFVIPAVWKSEGRETPAKAHARQVAKSADIDPDSFQKVIQADYMARLAVFPPFQQIQASQPQSQAKKTDFAAQGAKVYRDLAIHSHGVLSARRMLILDHLDKKPLDEPFLTGTLASNLQTSGADAGAITSEVALWRSLYGKDAPPVTDKRDVDDRVRRIRGFKIGLLEGIAVSDVYTQAGRTQEAKAARTDAESRASLQLLRLFGIFGVMFVAGVGGVLLLLVFFATLKSAKHRFEQERSGNVPGVAPPPGDLLDIFIAYLVLVRGTGLFVGLIPGIEHLPVVLLTAGVYVGSGMLAVAYFFTKAARGNWSLASLGVRSPGGISGNIWYGLAGYCVALPVVAVLSLIASTYRSHIDSSPNPVIPMIAGEGSAIGRVALYLLVAVAAPVLEEFFFRGVLYTALRTRFSFPVSVVVSAACFALVHPIGDWLMIFGLGCVLATVREMRQSLLPGMVVHFCQNSASFLMMSALFAK